MTTGLAMPRDSNEHPEKFLSVLREGLPALLITVDQDGFPHTAFTFAAATLAQQVAFVVDDVSTTLANIERTGIASIQILAKDNQVYLLKGKVRISESRMKHSPVASRRAIIELHSVRNQAWAEIAVSPLTYINSPRAALLWANAVPKIYAELRGESSE